MTYSTNLTREQIEAKREELEKRIMILITKFEEEANLIVDGIELKTQTAIPGERTLFPAFKLTISVRLP